MSDLLLRTRSHLLQGYNSLTVAHYSDGITRKIHLEGARDSLARAFIPGADAPYGQAEEWLLSVIATCITDSTDLDCTSESQARYIVDELFKHLMPEEGK